MFDLFSRDFTDAEGKAFALDNLLFQGFLPLHHVVVEQDLLDDDLDLLEMRSVLDEEGLAWFSNDSGCVVDLLLVVLWLSELNPECTLVEYLVVESPLDFLGETDEFLEGARTVVLLLEFLKDGVVCYFDEELWDEQLVSELFVFSIL
jgi:hypothetical protein